MTTGPRQRCHRALLVCAMTVAVLAASEGAMAGILDLFFGEGPVLEQRARMGSAGLSVQANFRVARKCSYDFDLRALHQHGHMHELDTVFAGDVFPVPVTLTVFREGAPGAGEVVRIQEAPRISGHASSMTILNVGSASLERGRYRVQLASAAVPALTDIDIDFVVQIRPKTSCT